MFCIICFFGNDAVVSAYGGDDPDSREKDIKMKKKIILLVTDIVIAALILLGVWIINYKIRRMRLIKQILFHTAVICGLV